MLKIWHKNKKFAKLLERDYGMTTTPYFTDRYPHVRYGHGVAADTAFQNAMIMAQPHRDHYSQRDRSTRSYLDTTLNMYSSQLRSLPAYGTTPKPPYGSLPKPKFTTRDYVRYMPIDSAVDMFKNRYMTSSTLSKYCRNSKVCRWQKIIKGSQQVF